MEIAASMGARPHRRKHPRGGGRFREEIEMDRGSPSIPRGPAYGFAAAVREPLVRLQRPKFDFERWDWDYFAWPHDRLDANLEMRDSDPEATLEADRKTSENFLNRSMLQLERYAMDQDTQERHAAAWPHEQLGANLEMRDNDCEATLEEDRKASESFLNWSMLQLEGYVMNQCLQEQNAIALPHDQHGAIQQMRDCNRKGTLDADQKASVSLLSQSRLQLKRGEMDQDQHSEEQQKESELRTSLLFDGKPIGHRSKRPRRECAEANGILDHGRALQSSLAF